jgi:hypothetical protein
MSNVPKPLSEIELRIWKETLRASDPDRGLASFIPPKPLLDVPKDAFFGLDRSQMPARFTQRYRSETRLGSFLTWFTYVVMRFANWLVLLDDKRFSARRIP